MPNNKIVTPIIIPILLPIILSFVSPFIVYNYYENIKVKQFNYQCDNLDQSILSYDLLDQLEQDNKLLDVYTKNISITRFVFFTDRHRFVKYRVNKTSEICVDASRILNYGYDLDTIIKSNNTIIGNAGYVLSHNLFKMKEQNKANDIAITALVLSASNNNQRIFICFESQFDLNYKLFITTICKDLQYRMDYFHAYLIMLIVTFIIVFTLIVTINLLMIENKPDFTIKDLLIICASCTISILVTLIIGIIEELIMYLIVELTSNNSFSNNEVVALYQSYSRATI